MTDKTPTPTVLEMDTIRPPGHIIPHTWYQKLVKEGKVGRSAEPVKRAYLAAIAILSEICYWYRITYVKDETTGRVIRIEKKFAEDKLQRSYQALADFFGLGKQQTKTACKWLECEGYITLELRDITFRGTRLHDVLFIEPVVEAIRELAQPINEKAYPPVGQGTPPSRPSDTCTNSSTDISTKTNPPSAELVKPPLKNTEKLCNPESNLEEKPLEGVIIEEPDETIPSKYTPIEVTPYATTLFCPVCNHTQEWPRTKTARRKHPRLICGGCGGYFRVTVEGEDRAYFLKLPERVWKVTTHHLGPFPCTEAEYYEFVECWKADAQIFGSVLEWWMKEMWPRQPIKEIVIARCIAGWRSRKKKEPVVPEPEPINLIVPGWDD